MTIRYLIMSIAFFLGPMPLMAQGKATAVRETVEYVLRVFGKEAVEVGSETLIRKSEVLVLKHGDEALLAFKNVGPKTFRLVEEAGEHGTSAVKLMAKQGDNAVWVVAKPKRLAIFVKYGDEAAEAMIKHGEVAEPLIESLGKPAASALKSVTSQNGRRLAMMSVDGELAKIGSTPELLGITTKYGDKAMDFIWRNKGSLMVASTLTAFIANPEPFINGTADITRIVADSTIKPIVTEAAKATNWTLLFAIIVSLTAVYLTVRYWPLKKEKPSVPPKLPGKSVN